jgi:hypothetical protein
MLRRRLLFPAVYPFFLLPAFGSSVEAKVAVFLACPCLALAINFRPITRIVVLLLTALSTLVPLLLAVQTVVCTSPAHISAGSLPHCIVQRSLAVVLNVCLLGSVFLLAAANEWRGSLVATVNGMYLPRNIRVMAILSGAMISGFRRSALRVHHAFTARGEAMPSVHWRNLIALPAMLGTVWASELNSMVERMKGQWSSDTFWARYVPADRPTDSRSMNSDVMVLVAGGLLLGVLLVSLRS